MGARAETGLTRIAGALFDMDGVLTDTAKVHAAAWKRLFDDYLESRASRFGETFRPFDEDRDYREFVDGKLRQDGVASFLAARGISLPDGHEEDGPGQETVWGLAHRKNRYFRSWLAQHAVPPFADAVTLVEDLRAAGVKTAVFSASRNVHTVLRRAGLRRLFDVSVDGNDAAEMGLAGKPDPATLHEAARRLGVAPAEAAIFEDAIAGVEAGVRGGFGLVVGIARHDGADALRSAGAQIVVSHLAEILRTPAGELGLKTRQNLPLAADREGEIRHRLGQRLPALFVAYEGTVAPIVEDRRKRLLAERLRTVIAELATYCPVIIMSDHHADTLRRRVGLDAVHYAGGKTGVTVSRPRGGSARFGQDVARDRGRVVNGILDHLGLNRPDVMPIYIGHHAADEHAFRTLVGRGISVVVSDRSSRSTAADYAVFDATELKRLLELLVTIAIDRRAAARKAAWRA